MHIDHKDITCSDLLGALMRCNWTEKRRRTGEAKEALVGLSPRRGIPQPHV